MRYLTYDEYINIGGTLDETAFERVIDRACGVIDCYTQNRLQANFKVSEKIQYCVRDLCECLDVSKAVKGKLASKSQSAGGVSETESYVSKASNEVNAETRDIVFDYLVMETDVNGTPLLYRGCEP